jgi:uncharacterized damage-inducible protein DinB
MNFLPDITHEFRRHRDLAERALAHLDDAVFFHRPGPAVNPLALIVKHLAGNLLSRWTDFLTTDGEKPSRQRDSEFLLAEQDTRTRLMEGWQRGWQALFDTLAMLQEADLARTITIRGEPFTVQQALFRGATHMAYHVGQILYLARLLQPDREWLTIAPGKSDITRDQYLK